MRRFLPLLLLLPLAACENGQQFDAQKFFNSIKQAGNAATQNNLAESAKSAENAGDFREAADYYEQALKIDPMNRDLKMSLADSYRRSGNPDRAITIYDDLLKEDTSFLAAKEGKGLALMAKGDYQTPAALFDQVIKADHTRWKSLNALGILFSTRKLYNEAEQYFSEALKHQTNAGVMNNAGLTQALQKNYEPAIENLSQAVIMAERNSADRKRIDLNLALVYAAAGNMDAAREIVAHYAPAESRDYEISLYAPLAKDSKRAADYLHLALTEGKTPSEKARESEKPAATVINSDGEVEPKWTVVPNKPSNSKSAQAVKGKKPAKKSAQKKAKPKIVEAKPAEKAPADDPLSKIVGAGE
jgi:Flp pilus assembly protein TadD